MSCQDDRLILIQKFMENLKKQLNTALNDLVNSKGGSLKNAFFSIYVPQKKYENFAIFTWCVLTNMAFLFKSKGLSYKKKYSF